MPGIGCTTAGVNPSRGLSIKHDVDPAEVVEVGGHIEALVPRRRTRKAA